MKSKLLILAACGMLQGCVYGHPGYTYSIPYSYPVGTYTRESYNLWVHPGGTGVYLHPYNYRAPIVPPGCYREWRTGSYVCR